MDISSQRGTDPKVICRVNPEYTYDADGFEYVYPEDVLGGHRTIYVRILLNKCINSFQILYR